MQSRALTTQAQVLTQLNNPPMPFSCTSVSSMKVVPSEDPQNKLNEIADQASNFGFGCGVILRKVIDQAKTLCENLNTKFKKLEPNMYDYWFSDNYVYTYLSHSAFSRDKKVLNECDQLVKTLETDLENLTQPKMKR